MGRIRGPIHLVQTEAGARKLGLAPDTPVAYVSQTMLSVEEIRSIIAVLKDRFPDITGPETKDIYYATIMRLKTGKVPCAPTAGLPISPSSALPLAPPPLKSSPGVYWTPYAALGLWN